MTVKANPTKADLPVGKWVNLQPVIRFGYAGVVGRVVRLGGATAFIQTYRNAGEATECVKLRSIAFACDTREEAQTLFESSTTFSTKALAHERKLLNRVDRARHRQVVDLVTRLNHAQKH